MDRTLNKEALERATNFKHVAALDGLRGVAVLFVIFGHTSLPFFSGGFVGVDIFFALSGYLITSLLLKEWALTGTVSLRNFYIRRCLRLFPAVLLLAIYYARWAYMGLGNTLFASFKDVAPMLFYYANWARIACKLHPLLGHTWSLAIEEQFYLLWPPLFLFLMWTCRDFKRIMKILALLIASIMALKMFAWSHDWGFTRIYMGSDTRFDNLLFGVLVAFFNLHFGHSMKPLRSAFVAIGCVIWLLFMLGTGNYTTMFMNVWGYTSIALASSLLIVRLTKVTSSNVFSFVFSLSWLRNIGKISYGLYLWNWPSVNLALDLSKTHALGTVTQHLLGVVLTFAFALFSYFVIERPFLLLKEKFSVAKKKRAEPPADAKDTLP